MMLRVEVIKQPKNWPGPETTEGVRDLIIASIPFNDDDMHNITRVIYSTENSFCI